MKRIPPDTITRKLSQRNYLINHLFMSNIILIQNPNPTEDDPFDTLYIFIEDTFRRDYYYYRIIINISQTKYPVCLLTPGQYINALQLNQGIGQSSALIQTEQLPLLTSRSSETCNIFNVNFIITSSANPQKDQHPVAVIFESNDDFNQFISLCKIATNFNNNRFILTILPFP